MLESVEMPGVFGQYAKYKNLGDYINVIIKTYGYYVFICLELLVITLTLNTQIYYLLSNFIIISQSCIIIIKLYTTIGWNPCHLVANFQNFKNKVVYWSKIVCKRTDNKVVYYSQSLLGQGSQAAIVSVFELLSAFGTRYKMT